MINSFNWWRLDPGCPSPPTPSPPATPGWFRRGSWPPTVTPTPSTSTPTPPSSGWGFNGGSHQIGLWWGLVYQDKSDIIWSSCRRRWGWWTHWGLTRWGWRLGGHFVWLLLMGGQVNTPRFARCRLLRSSWNIGIICKTEELFIDLTKYVSVYLCIAGIVFPRNYSL